MRLNARDKASILRALLSSVILPEKAVYEQAVKDFTVELKKAVGECVSDEHMEILESYGATDTIYDTYDTQFSMRIEVNPPLRIPANRSKYIDRLLESLHASQDRTMSVMAALKKAVKACEDYRNAKNVAEHKIKQLMSLAKTVEYVKKEWPESAPIIDKLMETVEDVTPAQTEYPKLNTLLLSA